jgi:hypothetical protein
MRQGQSLQHGETPSTEKGRWSIGITLWWVLTRVGQVVAWDGDTMLLLDPAFHPLIEPFRGRSIVLADDGFRTTGGVPEHGAGCANGTWNDRMNVETSFSLLTVRCGLTKIFHHLDPFLRMYVASEFALCTVLLAVFHPIHPDADPLNRSRAAFSFYTRTIG